MGIEESINSKFFQNVQNHYGSLIKAGATSFGKDEMSISIFNKIDTDKDGIISQKEIDAVKSSIGQIIGEAIIGASKAKTMSRVQEKVLNDDIQTAYNKVLEYAKNHPEDERIQQYAKLAKEMMQNGKIQAGSIPQEHTAGIYDADTSAITLDFDEYKNSDQVLVILLHELGHAIGKDGLDSISEEKDVESYAREIAAKITGKSKEEISDISIDEFLQPYKDSNYPQSSPGYDGIPKNAGITIDYEIQSVEHEGNNYKIKSGPIENGRYIETVIIMGKNTDSEGNLLPESVQQHLYDSTGNNIETTLFSEYDSEQRCFIRKSFVSLIKPNEELEKLSEGNINDKMQEIELDFGAM